ncbi:MAG: hypothetical protein K8M05_16465 [Deltaproteobacteria bacterium]|nr:hypothetical protein [Kofleriaceae bacterium]
MRHRATGGTVWIYKGESTLLLGCDAARLVPPLCVREGAGVVAALELDRPGTYHVLTSVSSRLSRQEAPATLDEALAALTTAGARFRHDELDVR